MSYADEFNKRVLKLEKQLKRDGLQTAVISQENSDLISRIDIANGQAHMSFNLTSTPGERMRGLFGPKNEFTYAVLIDRNDGYEPVQHAIENRADIQHLAKVIETDFEQRSIRPTSPEPT